MDSTQQLMIIFTMLLSMVFVYLSVQENFHCNSYELNVIRISAKIQSWEEGETLMVRSLIVHPLLLYIETK